MIFDGTGGQLGQHDILVPFAPDQEHAFPFPLQTAGHRSFPGYLLRHGNVQQSTELNRQAVLHYRDTPVKQTLRNPSILRTITTLRLYSVLSIPQPAK